MKRMIFFLSLFVIFLCSKTYAQIITEEVNHQELLSRIYVKDTVDIPVIKVSPITNSNIKLGNHGGAFRYGRSIETNITLNNSGKWYTQPKGNKIWVVKIFAENAKSLDFEFDVFKLSKSAVLQIYSLKDNIIQGPFIHNENKITQVLATDLIYSDEIILELVVPENEMNQNNLSINKLIYGYYKKDSTRQSIQELYGASAMASTSLPCHNDVNCYSNYSDEKGAVALLKYRDEFFGSSVLVNDAAGNGRYLLSSRHQWSYVVGGDSLVKHQDSLNIIVVKFFYMSSSCNGSALTKSYSVNGLTVKQEYYDEPDLVLCELQELPRWSKNCLPGPCVIDREASYLGWSIIRDAPTGMTGIHYPQGDLMKITFYDFENTTYLSGIGYMYVSQYNSGIFENGSSGSPLMDQNKRLIGILHGSPLTSPPTYASCSTVVDLYSTRISKYWSDLSTFLDPNNEGVVSLNTRSSSNWFPSKIIMSVSNDKSVLCYGQTATLEVQNFGEIFENNVTWSTTNSGIVDTTITENGKKFLVSPKYLSSSGNITVTTQVDFGSFTKTYSNNIYIGKPNYSSLDLVTTNSGGSHEIMACDYTSADAQYDGGSGHAIDIDEYDWDIPYASDWDIDEEYGGGGIDMRYVEIDYWEDPAPSTEVIKLRAHNGCGWGSWKSITVDVEDNCGGWYLMFTPNPADGETILSIETSAPKETVNKSAAAETVFDENVEWNIEVYDHFKNSKLIKNKQKGKSMQMETANWENGVYVVRVLYKDRIITGKLMVEK